MEVKIIRKTDDEIEMEIRGETHTLMNALKARCSRTRPSRRRPIPSGSRA
jgi:DNA-directed RNA polymerase subunit L